MEGLFNKKLFDNSYKMSIDSAKNKIMEIKEEKLKREIQKFIPHFEEKVLKIIESTQQSKIKLEKVENLLGRFNNLKKREGENTPRLDSGLMYEDLILQYPTIQNQMTADIEEKISFVEKYESQTIESKKLAKLYPQLSFAEREKIREQENQKEKETKTPSQLI